MYDSKEQAKIYLDRIDAKRKTASTTLLILIPIIILLLLEVQKNYGVVRQYTSGREKNFALADKKITALEKIDSINKQIGRFISKLPDSIASIADSNKKKSAIKVYVSEKESEKAAQRSALRQYRKEKRVQNDTLESHINKLRIPLELPLLKKTENLTIQSVIITTMFLFSLTLLYIYLTRSNIINLLKKFSDLQNEVSASNPNGVYKDVQLNLPIWLFPIRNLFIKENDTQLIADVIHIERSGLKQRNFLASCLWILVLLFNIFLARLNWNINYKVYHTHYSFFICIDLLLLVVDLFICYHLIMPSFKYNRNNNTSKQNIITRDKFIYLSAAAIACFVIEPVNSKLFKGRKWFHNPRFINKPKREFKDLSPGFYTNISKSKKKDHKLHYVFSKKNELFKTVPIPEKFEKNLKPVSLKQVQKDSFLRSLKQTSLLEFFKHNKVEIDKSLILMNKFLDNTKERISFEFIDTYSSLYDIQRRQKHNPIHIHRKILFEISQVSTEPLNYLPSKYLTDSAQIRTDKRADFIKTKNELQQQLVKRIQNWNKKLK